MTNQYSPGDNVKWKWGSGQAEGTVQSRFEEKTTRKIKGKEITRQGSKEDPAYYIKQADGDTVLKLGSELES